MRKLAIIVAVLLVSLSNTALAVDCAAPCPNVTGDWAGTVKAVYWDSSAQEYGYEDIPVSINIADQLGCRFYGALTPSGEDPNPLTGVIMDRTTIYGGDGETNYDGTLTGCNTSTGKYMKLKLRIHEHYIWLDSTDFLMSGFATLTRQK